MRTPRAASVASDESWSPGPAINNPASTSAAPTKRASAMPSAQPCRTHHAATSCVAPSATSAVPRFAHSWRSASFSNP